MVKKYFIPRSRSQKLLALGLLLVAIALAVVILEVTNTTHFFHKPATKIVKTAGKPLPKPKPNTSSSMPAPAKTPSSPSSNIGNGTAIDTHGQSSATTSPSQWVTSTSGNITVKQPIANSKLGNGSVLSGSAKVSDVHYRLIDSNVGVIAQGMLGVVNGDFSGTLQFTPHSSVGRLDVFSTETDGTEINEVQITVAF